MRCGGRQWRGKKRAGRRSQVVGGGDGARQRQREIMRGKVREREAESRGRERERETEQTDTEETRCLGRLVMKYDGKDTGSEMGVYETRINCGCNIVRGWV